MFQLQKQPPRGKCVQKMCSKFTGEHPCRSAITRGEFSRLEFWGNKFFTEVGELEKDQVTKTDISVWLSVNHLLSKILLWMCFKFCIKLLVILFIYIKLFQRKQVTLQKTNLFIEDFFSKRDQNTMVSSGSTLIYQGYH